MKFTMAKVMLALGIAICTIEVLAQSLESWIRNVPGEWRKCSLPRRVRSSRRK